jgi:hypothetical protein
MTLEYVTQDKVLQQMPPVDYRSPRYTKSLFYACDDLRNDASNPPTDAERQIAATTAVMAAVKQFSQSADDIVHFTWPIPTDMYSSDGVNAYLGWVPGASWTTGTYDWTINRRNKAIGDALGAAAHTVINNNVTPADATAGREDLIGNIVTPSTADIVYITIFLDASDSTADDVGELIYLKMEYSAWRAGTALGPNQRVG